KRTRRVIVGDHLEELFEANVAEADRAAFLKNLIEIAQSYATSVVLVVDHALIGQCDELHELKASLGTRFHVRVPVSGQPASAPATEITDWSKFSTKDADETPTPEPVAKTAVEVAIEPSPETPELVPIPEIVTNPEKVPAPTKGFDSAALKLDDETAEDPNELLFPVDPVPISSSVAGNSESFWRQMTWVWMAGYGVALIMIVGLVILGTSAPDPAKTDEPEATAAADSPSEYPGDQTQVIANATAPARRLTPVSASAADLPRKPLDSAALEAAILEFEADNSSAMLPDRLNKAFTGDAKIWLTRARRSKACLATELGRLYSLVSLKTHDNAKALHWFEQAAAQGCPEGGFYAGQALFFATTGIERDPVRAVDHFLASAQFGESRSAYLMGVCRLLGDGVLRNSSIAEEWLKRSISLGGIEAFQELAMMRERGIGNSVDLPAAAELYRTGAEAGNRYCMEKCIQLLAEATGEESKRDAAAEIWRQRASQSEINELQLQVRALAPGLYR
ncbi:MAG: TPR repeat protein, partial [Verrucomicrobiales bacterium]